MPDKLLTHKAAENAKPQDKPYKLSSGRGFYLYITPNGGKLWRFDYTINGKRKTASLGKFPEVSISQAMEVKMAYSKQIKSGIDPIEEKKRVKQQAEKEAAEKSRTFEVVAWEWFTKKCSNKSERNQKQIKNNVQNQILPYLGNRPIAELETQDYLIPSKAAEQRGCIEQGRRLAQLIKQICRFAKSSGYVKHNEALDINDALQERSKHIHRAAITEPTQVGILLNALEEYDGFISIRYALQIMPYVFVRSQELRGAKWDEINFEESVWTIPACRMKRPFIHFVPLAKQVKKKLLELKEWGLDTEYIFPSSHSSTRCISDMGLLNALRRLGYGKDEMCVHGFRAMASTLLNELGYRGDVIEAQLAHAQSDVVRAAYNRADYLKERSKLMQGWADYLDKLKLSAKPVLHTNSSFMFTKHNIEMIQNKQLVG